MTTTTSTTAPPAVSWVAHPGGRHTGSTAQGHKCVVQAIKGRRNAWMASAPSGRRVGSGFTDSVTDAKSAAEDAITPGSSSGTRAPLAPGTPWPGHMAAKLNWAVDVDAKRMSATTPAGYEVVVQAVGAGWGWLVKDQAGQVIASGLETELLTAEQSAARNCPGAVTP